MKRYILITGIVVLAAGSILTGCHTNKVVFKTIQATGATRIAANKNIVILDVRTPKEFSEGHLPNAINVDFIDPSFAGKTVGMNKKKKYLVYCRTGQRSTQAVEIMKKQGFKNVTNMLGGFSQWQGQVIK